MILPLSPHPMVTTRAPFAWWDFSDGKTITPRDIFISQITDKSGHSHTLIQETEANQPTYTDTINGKKVATFNGADYTMYSNEAASVWKFLHNGSPYTIIAVISPDSTGLAIQAVLTTYNTASAAVGFGANFYNTGNELSFFMVRGVSGNPVITANSGAGSFLDDEVNIAQWDFQYNRAGNDLEFYKNGALITGAESVNAPSAADPLNTLYLGSYSDTVYFFKGKMGEILVYDYILSAIERAGITSYLTNRWGI